MRRKGKQKTAHALITQADFNNLSKILTGKQRRRRRGSAMAGGQWSLGSGGLILMLSYAVR